MEQEINGKVSNETFKTALEWIFNRNASLAVLNITMDIMIYDRNAVLKAFDVRSPVQNGGSPFEFHN